MASTRSVTAKKASKKASTSKKATTAKKAKPTAPAAAPRGVTRKTATQPRRGHRGQFVPETPPRSGTPQSSRTTSPESIEEAPSPSSFHTRNPLDDLSKAEIAYRLSKRRARKSQSHKSRPHRSNPRRYGYESSSSSDLEEGDPPESWYHQTTMTREVARLLWWGLEAKTRRSYPTSITAYSAHCAIHGFNPPFPTSLKSLASWVSELSIKHVEAKTIDSYLTDVKSAHVDMGYEDLTARSFIW